MSRFEGLSERTRVVPPVVVGAGVLLFSYAAQFVSTAIFYATALAQGSGFQQGAFGVFVSPEYLFVTVGYSVGVFAVLWLFAPLTAGLRLGGVIARSLLAVAGGAILMFLVTFAIQMQAWLAGAQFFSNSLGQATESFARDGGNALGFAISSSVQLAVNALPLTVLAVVLMWSWIVRHPAYQAEGAPAVEV